jgi:site-specific DNA-cytosine methylase
MTYKTASMVPLIGGMPIAMEKVFGTPPEALISFECMADNEKHLLNWYKQRGIEPEYYFIDKGDFPKQAGKYDVIESTCPCAGLSMLSTGFGEHNPNNQYMLRSAEYVLGTLKPKVYWGENAPGLAGSIGKPIREKLYKIARDNNYTMTLYRTKSLLHGVPQIRERTFYFFWKGDKTPILNYYNIPYDKIEDLITSVKSNFQMEPINKAKPTDDPYYRYLLEQVHGGIDHREHFNKLDTDRFVSRCYDAKTLIEGHDHDYKKVGAWMKKNGYDKEVDKCDRAYEKLKAGGNIMRRGTIIPKDYIGAFVGHLPTMLTHPYEDRYITYREAMTIMSLPEDYELLDAKKSYNHICQNVPVRTAVDMSKEVKAVLDGEREYVYNPLVFQYNSKRSHEVFDDTTSSLEGFL